MKSNGSRVAWVRGALRCSVCANARAAAGSTPSPLAARAVGGGDGGCDSPHGGTRRGAKGARALCRAFGLPCIAPGRGTRMTQPVPARGSPRRISAGVTPAPERSDRRTGTPAAISPRGSHGLGRASRAHHGPKQNGRARHDCQRDRSTIHPPRAGQATSATTSASSGLGTSHSFAHLRHFRNAPRVLLLLASAPTYPHSGHASATGLSHTTKSQFG